jgi:hypothetical protein
MTNNREPSLKSLNIKWLAVLLFADALLIIFIIEPSFLREISQDNIKLGRLFFAAFTPLVVLLIVNLLPHELKSMLVYWKKYGYLPSSESFTKYGPRDHRINMISLQNNIGGLPTSVTEQNSIWYKLYKQVINEPEIIEAHKLFLMYRDMATLTLSLIILTPILGCIFGMAKNATLLATALLIIQYLLTAVSARWSGIRFVCNVLAIHSTK